MALFEVLSVFPDAVATVGIPICAISGVVFAFFLWYRVSQIRVGGGSSVRVENGREYLLEEEQRGESEVSPGGLYQFYDLDKFQTYLAVYILCLFDDTLGISPADRGEGCRIAVGDQRGSQEFLVHRIQICQHLHGYVFRSYLRLA